MAPWGVDAPASNVHFIRLAEFPPPVSTLTTSHWLADPADPASRMKVKLATMGTALIARLAVRVVFPSVALIVMFAAAAVSTLTLNVAVVEPCGTVTLPGTEAALALLLERPTFVPPDAAAPERVTVPVTVPMPLTVLGDSDTDTRSRATLTLVVRAPPKLPVIVAVPLPTPVTVNRSEVAPSAMSTVPGTVATLVLLLASVTTAPPALAARSSVAVP